MLTGVFMPIRMLRLVSPIHRNHDPPILPASTSTSHGRPKYLSAQDLIHFDSRLAYLVLHRPDLLLEVSTTVPLCSGSGGSGVRE